MKHYVEKIIPETTEEVLSDITCDLCGKGGGRDGWDSSHWGVSESEIEVTVKHKDGTAYPEGGSGTVYAPDICPTCFKEKLIPWLESHGCKAKREDWDW